MDRAALQLCAPPGAATALVPGPLFDAISQAAWTLRPPAPAEVYTVLRSEAGLLVDRLLVTVGWRGACTGCPGCARR